MSAQLRCHPPRVIYVLEDDPAVSDALVILLGNLGFDVLAFADAESFFAHPPPTRNDIVFVDLVLPGIGGSEVIRQLQHLGEPPHIVAMSGHSQRIIDAALRNLDALQVLRKPLTHDAIVAQLSPPAR